MTDEKILSKFATPLRNPTEIFDDWDDLEVDKAYLEEFVDKKVQELLDKKIIDIDDVVHILGNGAYVLPRRPGEPQFSIRALVEYCKQKGIDTSQITDEELETFVVNRDEFAEPYKDGTLKISESLPYDYDDFYKDLGIPDKKSQKEILKMIQGYIECAEENKKEAELTFPAQVEAVSKADKGGL
jgi:hypothetical protein